MNHQDESPSTLRTSPTFLFRLRDWRDEASWSEFYRLYYNYVSGTARRYGLSHADAQEITQDVFRRVAETIHEFESNPERGSFRGWLLNLTRWRIMDKLRARKPHEREGGGRGMGDDGSMRTSTIERLPDEREGDGAMEEAEWRRHVLDVALERLAQKVDAKHFQAFELYRRQCWPVLKVARELGMNPATVYVVGHRLTKLLRAEVERVSEQVG